MGTVNIQIDHDGYNLSGYVLSYERSNDLCSGVGTITVTVDNDTPRTFNQGDTIELYEDTVKKGEFYITQKYETPGSGIILECQDGTRWMETYFISTVYQTQGLTSRYWIGFILDLAGISYNFTTSEQGYALNPNDSLGLESAYEAVIRLCQQSGWYFYFSGSGVCQIGSLDAGWGSPSVNIITSNGKVLSELIDKNDDSLRNRVVVYGSDGVNVELKTLTPWNRGAGDYRTTVYANGYINDYWTATEIAKTILDEYSKTVSIKVYELAGHVNADVGDTAYCNTKVFKGVGRISSIVSKTTKDGFVTEVTLDRRCPRLVGYWRIDDEYIYIGTNGSGVYRKTLASNTWSDYSSGITNLYIRDLKVKNGFLACTSKDWQAYTRGVVDSAWTQITPSSFIVESGGSFRDVYTDNFKTRGVGIDENLGTVHVGYYNPPSGSWVMSTTPSSLNPQTWTKIIVDGEEVELLDIDTDNKNLVGTIVVSGGSTAPNNAVQGSSGEEPYYAFDTVSRGSPEDVTATLVFSGVYSEDNFIRNNKLWYLKSTSEVAYFDMQTQEVTVIDMDDTNFDAAILGAKNLYVTEDETEIHIFGYFSSTASRGHLVGDLVTKDYTVINSSVHAGSSEPAIQNGECVAFYLTSESDPDDWLDNRGMVVYNMLTEATYTQQGPNLYGGTYSKTTYDNYNTRTGFGFNISENGISVIHGLSFGLDENPVGIGGFFDIGKFTYSVINFDITTGTFSQELRIVLNEPIRQTPGPVYVSQTSGSKTTGYSYSGVGCHNRIFDGDVKYIEQAHYVEHPTNTIYKQSYNEWDTDGAGDPVDYLYDGINTGETFPLITKGTILYTLRRAQDSIGTYYWWGYNLTSSIATNFKYEGYAGYTGHCKLIDEADNSILILDFDDSLIPKGYDIQTGIRKKIYSGITYHGRDFLLLNGYLLFVEYSTRDYSMLYEIETPQGGISAISNGFVTLSGDTFGIMGTFDTAPSGGNWIYVDVPRESPILFFGGNPSGMVGEFKIAYGSGSGNALQSISNTVSIPSGIANLGFYKDARFAQVIGLDYSSPVKSITETSQDYYEFLFTVAYSGIYYKPLDLLDGGWKQFDSFDGLTHGLETTNYGVVPYFFVSTSGAPSTFWQEDDDSVIFNEKSTGLPNSNITVIRIDDKL
jgi:hypothetical protein